MTATEIVVAQEMTQQQTLTMRKIEFKGKETHVQARLHAMIYDPTDSKILFASFIDADTSVRSLASNIATNSGGVIYVRKDEGDPTNGYLTLYTHGSGNYKWTARKNGDSTHAIIKHTNCLIDLDPKEPIILAYDGDLIRAVGERLSKVYTIPNLPQWHEYLFDRLTQDGHIKGLAVMTTQFTSLWNGLQAVQLVGKTRRAKNGRDVLEAIPEEQILGYLQEGLQERLIFIPEGEHEAPELDPNIETLAEYLKIYAPMLVAQINEQHPPIHALEDPLFPYIAEMKRLPVPAQAIVANAIVRYFLSSKKRKSEPLLNADMGTGKSLLSLTVAYTMYRIGQERGKNRFLTLLQAPGNTIGKWINQEILPSVPDAIVHVWSSSIDVLRSVQSGELDTPGFHIVVVSRDKMKRGARYRFAGTWRRVASAHVMTLSNRYAWHCPSCAKPLMVGKKDEEEFVEWSEYAKGEEPEIEPGEPLRPDGTPLRVQVKWKSADPKLKCRHCGEAMVRPMQKRVMKETYISEHEDMQIFRSKRNEMNESKEKISWGMDLAIRHFHKRLKIDLFIADEIHQLKAGDSAQGLSFGTVAECSKHVISLTGTLTGGRASDIFHILWRTAVQTMKQEGFTHKSESRFSKRYGVFQEIVRQQEEYGSQSRRRKEKVTTKELPGLSPHLYYLIMDSLISLELENLGLPLVKLNEKAEFVEMNAKTLKAYTKFDEHLQSSARQRTRDGQRGAWSNYIPGTITKADMPFVPDEYLEEKIDGRIPRDLIYKKQFNEKEKKLVEMVAKERKEGRRVMVYTTYVGKFRHAERLAYVLQQAGFKAAELKAVNAERRMEQIDEMVEDGVEVVVLNMKLVEVGMDLLNFPTIIYFQLNDHISTVRQAARRAWRLGQTRECRVFYLVWKETYQTKQFQRTMMKRAHAMLLEGRIDKSSLAEFGSSDVHASLTKTIVDAIGDVDDLAKKWESLAAKDIPKGVEMMEENELADALKKAFQELGDETRILCGQKPLHSIPASKKKKVYQAVLEESKTEAKSLADVISAVQSSLFQTGVVQATPSSQKSKKRIASSNDKSVQLSLL